MHNVPEILPEVAILDAGCQFAKLIDDRVKELWIKSVLLSPHTPLEELQKYKAIIISGSQRSVNEKDLLTIDPKIRDSKIPLLGICYGMQLMNVMSGGKVETTGTREDGQDKVRLLGASPLRAGLQDEEFFLLTHGDTVTQPAPGFKVNALSSQNLCAGIEDGANKKYGVQFHPEVDLSLKWGVVLDNFLYGIAWCTWGYERQSLLDEIKAEMLQDPLVQQVFAGDKKFLVLASGGVDSTVMAALLTQVVGRENLLLLHIDNGFMRAYESEETVIRLAKIGLDVKLIEAGDHFLNSTVTLDGQETPKLSATTDPEHKRKNIGKTYMKVAQSYLAQQGIRQEDIIIAQGTLSTDLTESGHSSSATWVQSDTIKTHHNNVQEVIDLRAQGKIYEPLKHLVKQNVRTLAELLNMPDAIMQKQPFPGPWLAIRIICATAATQDEKIARINNELQTFLSSEPTLSWSVLPIKTVGVQWSGKSYKYGVALSWDADRKKLFAIATALPKLQQFHDINRVVYVFGEPVRGPLNAITPTLLNKQTATQVRIADMIVNDILKKHQLDTATTISQMPVILTPVSFGVEGARSLVLRPFITQDFRTGLAALPGEDIPTDVLQEMVDALLSGVPGISRVMLDLTGKPPATTERE
jgi:GMP synthase (glutamine-hydrolysing)